MEDIKSGVRQLNRQELAEFRRWFMEYDSEAWDREIEEDALAGRLDRFAEEAIRDFREGRCTAL